MMRALQRCLTISIMALASISAASSAYANALEISAAKELVWDQTKGVYQAIGDAKAIRGTQSISADILKAFYDSASEDQDISRITATTNVSFADGDISGRGRSLDYNVATNFYELTGPKASVTSKDGTSRADELITFDRAAGMIYLQKNGEITLADGRILQGDMIDISLSADEAIQSVQASGNVYVRQADGKEAYSQTGTYDAQTGKALLTGDVKIIDGESVLNGQRAEIDFNNGISRLLAEEGTGRVSGTLVTSGD